MSRSIEDVSSIEAESGVLATLVKHPDYFLTAEYLSPRDFYNSENGYIYFAIGELAKKDIKEIDTYAILNVLNMRKSTEPSACGITQRNVDELIINAGLIARDSVDAYRMLVDIVVDKSFRRKMLRTLSDCEDRKSVV